MKDLDNFALPINSTLLEAANIINESKSRACVIVEDDYHVVGILSEGDILRAILNDANPKSQIRPFMNTNFYFITDDKLNLQELKELFLIKQITIVPILNKDMKLIKVYTLRNFLKELIK